MRVIVAIFFIGVVLFGFKAGSALYSQISTYTNLATSFINDSVIIELGSSEPDDVFIDENDGEDTPPPDNSGDVIDFDDDNEEGGDEEDTIEEVVVGASDEGSENSGDSDSDNETVSSESILDTLTGNQAVSGGDSAVAGSEGGGSAEGASSGGGSGTSVFGEKTREALFSRGITHITIPPLPSSDEVRSPARVPYTRNDLALIVSAALVEYPSVEDVFFTTDALTISYKARGRLFVTIPLTYNAKVSLKFNEKTTKKRVSISFPWYRFLLWTGVSKSQLRTTIDGVISDTPEGGGYDRAALIFQNVTDILSGARGTVVGSVNTVE